MDNKITDERAVADQKKTKIDHNLICTRETNEHKVGDLIEDPKVIEEKMASGHHTHFVRVAKSKPADKSGA